MRIEGEDLLVEIELTEVDRNPYLDSVTCRVSAFRQNVGARDVFASFSERNVREFVETLEGLDETRHGSAQLSDMSSGSDYCQFELKIFSTDTLGHLAVRIVLRKIVFVNNSTEILSASVVSEMDPSSLPVIVRDFKMLFAPLLSTK